MKIVAVNATYRPKGTTTTLAAKALEGAAAAGAATEMILLRDLDICMCRNCLKCYGDLDSDLAPCTIDDDMTGVLERIRGADGVILASPVHSGFVTGLMTVFFERAIWRLCRPTGNIMGLRGCPEPRGTKVRALATIVSAGGMPDRLRRFCDQGTPWMKDNGGLMLNAQVVGDLYAGAVLTRMPKEEDWSRLYGLRELSGRQLKQAYDLGARLAAAIAGGNLRPPAASLSLFDRITATAIVKMIRLYKTVDEDRA